METIKNTGRGIAYVTHDQKRGEDLPATAALLEVGSAWRDRSNGLLVRVTRVYKYSVTYMATAGMFCGIMSLIQDILTSRVKLEERIKELSASCRAALTSNCTPQLRRCDDGWTRSIGW